MKFYTLIWAHGTRWVYINLRGDFRQVFRILYTKKIGQKNVLTGEICYYSYNREEEKHSLI
jgi:hypothetical protein